MTYKRENNATNKRYSRTIDQFMGLHVGYGWCDQPTGFSYGSDLHYGYKKGDLRPGCRRNQLQGYDNTIAGLDDITIGGISMLGVIQGGKLSVYPIDDVMLGIRRYYTWQDLYDNFTWDEINAKTWDDLFTGDEEAP